MSKRISFLRVLTLLVVVALGLYLLLSLVGGIVLIEGAMRMPRRRLAVSHVPALLISGLADDNIPTLHSKRIMGLTGITVSYGF